MYRFQLQKTAVNLKNMKKSSLNLHNGQTPESILQFTDNNIALKEGKISMEFEYNQIKKIKTILFF